MNAQVNVGDNLRSESSAPQSWQLAFNRVEHVRPAAMWNMIRALGSFLRGLEVGRTAGFFTKVLTSHGATLHVIGLLSEVFERAAVHFDHKQSCKCCESENRRMRTILSVHTCA
jgi:hypothetical protein